MLNSFEYKSGFGKAYEVAIAKKPTKLLNTWNVFASLALFQEFFAQCIRYQLHVPTYFFNK